MVKKQFDLTNPQHFFDSDLSPPHSKNLPKINFISCDKIVNYPSLYFLSLSDDGDGDQCSPFGPVSSTPVVIGSLDSAGAGLLD